MENSQVNKAQEKNNEEYRSFRQIVNIFYNEELEGIEPEGEAIKKVGNIRIEPEIYYDKFARRYESRIQNREW